MTITLKIGTRGSALALAQAEMTEAALRAAHPEIQLERVVVTTTGDARQDLKLSAPGVDKGVFTKELEIALADGSIDIAVHSLKDVPTVLDPQFVLTATLPRAPVEDVLVSKHPLPQGLDSLPEGANVATSSVRRARQLTYLRPDLNVDDIRGNVPTRIEKTAANTGADTTMLALAGLKRLGIWDGQSEEPYLCNGTPIYFAALDPNLFLPAAGQGAVAIEIRADDSATAALLAPINDPNTWSRVSAERRFLHLLEAGCQTPVGTHTTMNGNTLSLSVRVFPDDDGLPHIAEGSGPCAAPEALAQQVFDALTHL